MPILVQFGAGNIGRGFIAERFCAAGWEVIFIDVAADRVAELNSAGSYQVIVVDGVSERPQRVAPIRAIAAQDSGAVAMALASADLAATAVGLAVVDRLGAVIAQAMSLRGDRPLDILVCENGVTAPARLRDSVLAATDPADRASVNRCLGCVRTSIGRMIPAAHAGDGLDIRVEPYAKLPVDAAAFRGPIPQVPGLVALADFDLELARKIYLHNLTHACLAYGGAALGHATIPDCVADIGLRHAARRAGDESSAALAVNFGKDTAAQQHILSENAAMLDDLFQRYANGALDDPVTRVGRDPTRKLAADDRLCGAARLCEDAGLAWPTIAWFVLRALDWQPADTEPGVAEWREAQRLGPRPHLARIAGISLESSLMDTIALAERRAAAAAAMRQAGLVLREDEAAALEIADFGLRRFAEFGLAIHVYVNTDRCCAKELVMLPGQICPEHRHPPLDGDPGKEETFRVREGEVFLYLPGHKRESNARELALKHLPADKHNAFTVFKEVHLRPGEQYTLKPNTPHWFVAGATGAVVSEFSTRSRDEADVFTDTAIQRVPSAS
jgi:mannitol-1-phosphate/altronate dehydrogenase/D-lyxose ketol-isomerase